MTPKPDISLSDLWECATRAFEVLDTGHNDPSSVFGDIGLRIHKSKDGFRYHCTPTNCSVFANTAVDGCHWCVLELEGHDESELPVVFVSPMDFDDQHQIAGENLRDFLELGLASRTFDGVGDGSEKDWDDSEDDPLWEFLRSELSLAERNNPLPHLTRLHENYFKFLQIPEDT